MSIRIPNWYDADRIEELRKSVAIVMLLERARPSFVAASTGYSIDQVKGLRLRNHLPPPPHGPWPSSIFELLRDPDLRDEGAAAAVLWQRYRPIVDQPEPLTRLLRSERLCQTYLTLRAMVPHTHITLEELDLLIQAMEKDPEIALAPCRVCHGAAFRQPNHPLTTPLTCEACRRNGPSRRGKFSDGLSMLPANGVR